tara:strand:- start:147 stop:1199 length:1053 start_codon:yes stop_codon:yes gene_type:complete
MSININNILIKHLLINDELLKILEETKFNHFYIKPHYYFNLFDTIHFNTLLNNSYDLYENLVINTKQKEHSVEIFKNFLINFDIRKMQKIKLEYNLKYNKYIILDGNHRLAILIFKKIFNEEIPLKHFDIIYSNEVINNIKNIIIKTTSKNHYNGWNNKRINMIGYHSINIFNINLIGQRTPSKRIDNIIKNINVNNKIILDIGCNIGGMLLHLPKIKLGIGIDYDENCINSANYINNILQFNNLNFYKYDLNNFNIEIIKKKLEIDKIDIIFLFSMGSWIKNWQQLYLNCINNANIILLETNNDNEGKPQLKLFTDNKWKITLINNSSYDDNTKNYSRKLYLLQNIKNI